MRPTFGDGEGTWIGEEEGIVLEKAIISGVTHDTSEAKIVLAGVPDRPGAAARIFQGLAEAGVNVDMIVQNVVGARDDEHHVHDPEDGRGDRRPGARGRSQPRSAQRPIERDADIGKISLIGAGMKSHPGVAAEMFDALAEAGINIEIISTSSIRISCVVRAASSSARCGRPREVPDLRRGARRCLRSASSAPRAPSGR